MLTLRDGKNKTIHDLESMIQGGISSMTQKGNGNSRGALHELMMRHADLQKRLDTIEKLYQDE